MPDERGRETEEEALERVRIVRQTQIFGDTPTDPTIGDVAVPAHDEETANVAAAEVDARADDGDEAAADLSPEEAKRQTEALDADDVQDGAEEAGQTDEDSEEAGVESEDDSDADDSSDGEDLTAAEKVERIKAADSAEEVDRLAAGDDRKTVKDAAEAKRKSYGTG